MKQKHRTQAAILVLRTTSPSESSRLHMNVSLCLSKSTYQNCHQRGCTAGGRTHLPIQKVDFNDRIHALPVIASKTRTTAFINPYFFNFSCCCSMGLFHSSVIRMRRYGIQCYKAFYGFMFYFQLKTVVHACHYNGNIEFYIEILRHIRDQGKTSLAAVIIFVRLSCVIFCAPIIYFTQLKKTSRLGSCWRG